jgi:hypothetical protein
MSNDRQSQLDKTASLVGSIFNDTSTPAQSQGSISTPEQVTSKKDVFSERLTLPISLEQKQFLDGLISNLAKHKKINKKIINKNSIIRALIEVLIRADLQPEQMPKVDNEQAFNELIFNELQERKI